MSNLDRLNEQSRDGLLLNKTLADADRAMNTIPDTIRPLDIIMSFQRWVPINYADRLAYRSEPIFVGSDVQNRGFLAFASHVKRADHIFDIDLILRTQRVRNNLVAEQTCFLTQLDFALEVDHGKWPFLVRNSVMLLEDLWGAFQAKKHTLWHRNADETVERYENILTWVIGMRLVFYTGRLDQQSSPETYAAMLRMQADLGVPQDWRSIEQIDSLIPIFEDHIDRLEAQFLEQVPLEWVGPQPLLSDFTTPTVEPNAQCGICLDTIETPGVSTCCDHSFCPDCLSAWCFACQTMSHTCPSCRQKMFDQPEYRGVVRSEEDRNLVQDLRNCWTLLRQVRAIKASLWWLTCEAKFQEHCEGRMELARQALQ